MRILPLILLVIIFSCKQSGRNEEIETTDSIVSHSDETGETLIRNKPYYVWAVDAEAKTKTFNADLRGKDPHADSLIASINQGYENVLLEKRKISGDTIYLEIKDSEYLTQRMGSSGPAQWLADVVINLTSVKGIKYVNIHFEEGDHAGPGTWSLQDFDAIKAKK